MSGVDDGRSLPDSEFGPHSVTMTGTSAGQPNIGVASAPRTVEKLKGWKISYLRLDGLLSALILEVAFQQHMGGNNIPLCSKCHFMIAWAAACVANLLLRQGGISRSRLSVKPAAKGTRVTGKTGW